MKLFAIFCLFFFACVSSSAQDGSGKAVVIRKGSSSMPVVKSMSAVKSYSFVSSNSTAQGVAGIQASRGYLGHCGGSRGSEGVGYSSYSSDDAIKNCCYWGKKTPIDIGVARGLKGWYACVRYR